MQSVLEIRPEYALQSIIIVWASAGYVWILVRVASHAFFAAKLKYQRALLLELEGKGKHG